MDTLNLIVPNKSLCFNLYKKYIGLYIKQIIIIKKDILKKKSLKTYLKSISLVLSEITQKSVDNLKNKNVLIAHEKYFLFVEFSKIVRVQKQKWY